MYGLKVGSFTCSAKSAKVGLLEKCRTIVMKRLDCS
jgi:hypothetical protein